MKLELHDEDGGTPDDTVTVDYEYLAEHWVIDIEKYHPRIVRIVLDNGRRQWSRIDGRFVELSEGEKP